MTDKATQPYWDDNWKSAPVSVFDPDRSGVGNYVNRVLGETIDRTLAPLPATATVIEVGCANSPILPYVAAKLGFRIAGIDYSPAGCESIRQQLDRQGLAAQIECCDVFEAPPSMLNRYDALFSFGLVEHFTDTAHIVRALAALLRTGGRMLTLIPNLQGLPGFLQRIVGPAIYEIHEVLSADVLAQAHESAGLRIVEAGYMLPVGFGVLNYHEPAPRPVFLARRMLTGALARLSYVAWAVDDRVVRLPRTGFLSPYAYCIAQKA
jgi:2-polyprenyl-6-hydroxyphenyl methylase/3-demethylubiquinone-9 3-methyltransferase